MKLISSKNSMLGLFRSLLMFADNGDACLFKRDQISRYFVDMIVSIEFCIKETKFYLILEWLYFHQIRLPGGSQPDFQNLRSSLLSSA